MKVHFFAICVLVATVISCNISQEQVDSNPAASSFNLEDSDEKAIALADEVMAASGGRQNWDAAKYFSWNFNGGRKHYWNKETGDIRIESLRDSTIYLMNVNSIAGKVKIKDQEIRNRDTLAMHLIKGKSIWINDSYWLVMPFKMKDDGVTLKYLAEKPTSDGRVADVVEMTFENVGDTPKNKYHIFIDKESKLVTEWSFFREASQDTANFTMPWKGYEQYGNLLLSGDRGRLQLTEISVDAEWPEGILAEW